ncbi:hypothetical protein Tsubulata_005973 [Turnera subulata]|uniref:RRM domain-containing protein n=1 Tax=Turnera subulata TaxID=218843 RepID=A0A9Q0JF35_9ROSI|nr:hypothetical protein Tsubulata_005973 [Turnera subulata]
MDKGLLNSLYVENLSEGWKPTDVYRVMAKYGDVVDVYISHKRTRTGRRFGFVRFRGVRDCQRLLADVNRVQGEAGAVRASVARQRSQGAYSGLLRNQQLLPRSKDGTGSSPPQRGSYANAIRGKSEGGQSGTMARREDGNKQCVSFIPSTDANRWLARCAVGIIRDPKKMESACMLWRLHDMRDVEVTDMGGDSVLVCFPSPETMLRFSQQPPDWVSLWFRSFSPWKQGDRMINRRCCVTVRGVPLNAWCQEFFELVGAEFDCFLRVDNETERRRRLGTARIEILTEQIALIHKTLHVSIANCSYSLMVVEETARADELGGWRRGELPAMDDRSEDGEFREDRSEKESAFGQEDKEGKKSRADIQEESPDPFRIRQILCNNPCPDMREMALSNAPTMSPAVMGITTFENEEGGRLGSRCQLCSQPLGSVGFLPEPKPIRLSNSFGPLMGKGDEVSSAQDPPTGPRMTHYLVGKLDEAIQSARVCPRRKFTKVTAKGSETSRHSNNETIRRVNDGVIVPSAERTVDEPVVNVSSLQEAARTVQIGDDLGWEVDGNPQDVVESAKELVDKETVEWCSTRVDV